MSQNTIRNFSIIAHIDHGKSTLADRILEYTGAITPREFKDQILDDMELERERGITIKARSVRLQYTGKDKIDYIFNLIDTPGHVDFTYEVSRSLAACEGALLIVDASQGVEAQTIANWTLAEENNLALIPVINKIDLQSANIEKTKQQIEDVLGLDPDDAILASAKEGRGISEILEAVITKIPHPTGSQDKPLRALIFDSWFDTYQGAVVLIRLVDGSVHKGMQIRLISSGKEHEVLSLGVLCPKPKEVTSLSVGEVGYMVCGIRDLSETKLGDTVTEAGRLDTVPIPGYREMKPMVFCGLYAIDANFYQDLKESLEKLRLNDGSFQYEPETSLALGFGFRCGFLGLLHMEIIRERLEREYNLVLIGTAPTVVYRVTTKKGTILHIDNPAKLPPAEQIERFEEPYIRGTIYTKEAFLGALLKLCQDRRGVQKELKYLDIDRVMLVYEMPMNEIVLDFYDKLKSVSKGYASFDYEWIGLFEADLVKVDILLNDEMVDALSFIVNKACAYTRSKLMVEKLRETIPRQMFEVAIQAAIGSKIIARETVKA
ncbi:MAG: elongation factor 4, partial [Nitrospirae bacterium]|nr:elongation factor 4 [Candidatus Troglogloeales bacterium]